MNTTIPNPIKLNFDPLKSESDLLRWIFNDETARTLYLAWRTGHLCGEDFARDCKIFTLALKEAKPKTIPEFVAAYSATGLSMRDGDFKRADVESFAPLILPFLTGKEKLLWLVNLPGVEPWTEEEMDNAEEWEEGANAQQGGMAREFCEYSPGTNEYKAWQKGWGDAKEALEMEG